MTPVRLLSISDIHFGTTRIAPDSLAHNFRTHVLPRLATTDLLIVAGDFFDTALSLTDTITPSVMGVMFDLLATCAQHNVTVRFLRGTFSHERTQCQYFTMKHREHAFSNDLRYYDAITLEYIKRFDMRVLYLPDDLAYADSAAVLRVVHQKMQELGWIYVDYAVVHGYFDHVVPTGVHMPKGTYLREQFKFVKRYVLIGHVHKPTVFENFIYNGSFDRTAHGEEEPKGFMLLDDNGITAHLQFVPNPDATIFVTLDYSHVTDEGILIKHLCDTVQHYPKNKLSHVRIIHPNPAWRMGLLKYAKSQLAHITLSVKAPGDHMLQTEIRNAAVIDFTTYTKPTEETLPALILEHGDLTVKPSSLTEARIRELLKQASLA